MLRNLTDSNCLSERRSAAFFATDPGGSTGGHSAQESPWVGLLSAVSRPALSALHKFFPEHPRTLPGQLENIMADDFQHLSLRAERNLVPDSWISTSGLRELGIDSLSEVELNFNPDRQSGFLASQRTLVSFGRSELLEKSSQNWFGRFWDVETASRKGVSSDIWAKGRVLKAPHCPEKTDPKPSSFLWKVVEDSCCGGALNPDLDCPAAFTQERLVTPEQEHGYVSLEDIPVQQTGDLMETLAAASQESGSEPKAECRNKAIAFIMGLPCSDEEESQSDDDDDDDDGFDSQGSSQLSSSSDEEGEDGSGSNAESDRLWTLFLSTEDPYNPRNFTALQHTAHTLPQSTDSAPTTQSCERASPRPSSPPVLSSSPPCGSDTWDDSSSSSDDDDGDDDEDSDEEDEVDEEEAARLLSLFSSSDPYNPFNFQAPVRTRQPAECRNADGPGTLSPSRPNPPCQAAAPEVKQATPKSSRAKKKVHFCDDVEEFFAGSAEEDRRGPWEELARDRHRFLRRCQEVELSISYCLQPQHRQLVYVRIVSQQNT